MHRTLPIAARACLAFASMTLLVLSSGCRRPVYTVQTDGPIDSTFHQYRVLSDGQTIATFSPRNATRFDLKGNFFVSAAKTMDSLSVEAFTPCGWRAQSAKFENYDKKSPVQYLTVTETVEGWKDLKVFVDNRDGGPAAIAIGAYEQTVDAGQYSDLNFAVSAICPEADQLKLNGQVIASVNNLESERKVKNQLARILVDTTAKHCYAYEWTRYGEASPGFPAQGSEKLPAMRVRLFEGLIDYYFVDLPSQVMSSSGATTDARATLKDRDCAR